MTAFLRAVASLLLILAVQRLGAWPVPLAWYVGVGAAEWGHWLALGALALGCCRRDWPLRLICVAVVAVALAPCLSAWQRGMSWTRLVQPWSADTTPPRTLTLERGVLMDVYSPKVGHPSPTLLVVHGGSWARGSRQDFVAFNQRFRDLGYLVVSIDYRLAPAHPYPAAPEDLDMAWDYVRSHAAELGADPDPERMVWVGRSAGAHLALLEAYARRPSGAVVAFYPPTDMRWSFEHPSNPAVLDSSGAIRDFLGAEPDAAEARYREASPLQQVKAGAPPTLLLHGGRDDLVYPAQTRRLQQRLGELGVPCQVEWYPWANHGFDINPNGPSGQLSMAAVETFLARVCPP